MHRGLRREGGSGAARSPAPSKPQLPAEAGSGGSSLAPGGPPGLWLAVLAAAGTCLWQREARVDVTQCNMLMSCHAMPPPTCHLPTCHPPCNMARVDVTQCTSTSHLPPPTCPPRGGACPAGSARSPLLPQEGAARARGGHEEGTRPWARARPLPPPGPRPPRSSGGARLERWSRHVSRHVSLGGRPRPGLPEGFEISGGI